MVAIKSLRDGLKTRLATVTAPNGKTLHAYDTWPGSAMVPAAIVMPKSWEWRSLDGTLKLYRFEITVAVQVGNLASGQDEADDLASDTGTASIEAALFGDETLGGVAQNIERVAMHSYGELEIGTIVCLGFVFDVDVVA